VVSDPALARLLDESGIRTTDAAWKTLCARTFRRIVAHELGHLLLSSTDHTPAGLMRRSFGAVDMIGSMTDHFDVTPAQLSPLFAQTASAGSVAAGPRR
jgi:hypothetical protein